MKGFPVAERVFPGARASCPLEPLWAFGPLAGETPALPGGRLKRAFTANVIERLCKAMHDTVTRNHRCRSTHEPCRSVARLLDVFRPFPGNGHGAANLPQSGRMLRRILLVTLSPAVLPGCFTAPGVPERSALSTLSVPEQFAAPRMTDSRIVEGLLDVFDDDTLRRLVDQALSSNLDARLAARQLEQAGFEARAEVGNVVPKLTGTLSDSRVHEADGTTASRHTPSLDVSWEIDLWGRLRDQRASREATARASLEHYQAVRDSIAAQVMQAWFDVVTADRLARLERLRLDNLKKIVAYQRRTYEVGLGSLDDVAAVERDIAQTRATVTEYIGTRNDAARTLQVLMGAYPGRRRRPRLRAAGADSGTAGGNSGELAGGAPGSASRVAGSRRGRQVGTGCTEGDAPGTSADGHAGKGKRDIHEAGGWRIGVGARE